MRNIRCFKLYEFADTVIADTVILGSKIFNLTSTSLRAVRNIEILFFVKWILILLLGLLPSASMYAMFSLEPDLLHLVLFMGLGILVVSGFQYFSKRRRETREFFKEYLLHYLSLPTFTTMRLWKYLFLSAPGLKWSIIALYLNALFFLLISGVLNAGFLMGLLFALILFPSYYMIIVLPSSLLGPLLYSFQICLRGGFIAAVITGFTFPQDYWRVFFTYYSIIENLNSTILIEPLINAINSPYVAYMLFPVIALHWSMRSFWKTLTKHWESCTCDYCPYNNFFLNVESQYTPNQAPITDV